MKLFSHRNTSELARVYLEICDILMVWKLSLLGKENTLRWGIIQCTMTWLREHAHTHTRTELINAIYTKEKIISGTDSIMSPVSPT